MQKPFFLGLVLCGQMSIAQGQQPSQDEAEPVRYPQQILEEITVVGQRTFFSLRYQIEQAEEDAYALFNELNSSDEFDITCRNVKRVSHIGSRECEPYFLTNARRVNAVMSMADIREGLSGGGDFGGAGLEAGSGSASAMFQHGIDLLQSESDLSGGLGSDFEALNMEMLRIATENPAYLEALMQVGKLKAVLEEEREKKFGKSNKQD